MSIFSERLKLLRNNKQIKQKTIAEHLEITSNAYQNYEYGKREPDFTNLVKLCNYFNVSSDYLLGLSDDPTRH